MFNKDKMVITVKTLRPNYQSITIKNGKKKMIFGGVSVEQALKTFREMYKINT
jgi:ASC-1-like (ASCH) protein